MPADRTVDGIALGDVEFWKGPSARSTASSRRVDERWPFRGRRPGHRVNLGSAGRRTGGWDVEGDRVGRDFVEHTLRAGRGSGSRRRRLESALELLLHQGLGHHLTISLGRRAYGTKSGFHPDHVEAWLRLRRTLPRRVPYPWVSTLDLARLGPRTDMLVFGGSNSTDEAALLFEVSGPSTRRLVRRPDPILPLHWVGLSDRTDVRVAAPGVIRPRSGSAEPIGFFVNATTGQRAAPAVTTRLVVGGRTVQMHTGEELVVTVAPNIFAAPTTNRERLWPQLIILAGTTGLGTKSMELFFSEPGLAVLETITAELDGWPFFQAHLFLDGLVHPTRRDARYTQITLLDLRPVDVCLDQYDALHHSAIDQIDELPWRDRRSMFRDRQAVPPKRQRTDR